MVRASAALALAALAVSGCSLDRTGVGAGTPVDGGHHVDAHVEQPDAYVPPGADGGPPIDSFVPPRDGGPPCVAGCDGNTAVTCPGGVETRMDCGSAICDATGAPRCVPLVCTPDMLGCSSDGAAVEQCNHEGTMIASSPCARGCAAGACRDEIACTLSVAGTVADGSMAFDLCGAGDDTADNNLGDCGSTNADGQDVVVRLDVARRTHFDLRLRNTSGGDVDPLLYVRTACASRGSELDCNDDIDFGAGNLDASVALDLDAGEYFVIVDSTDWDAGSTHYRCGQVTLDVTATPL